LLDLFFSFEDGGSKFLRNDSGLIPFIGIKFQKTVLYIVTAMRTSNYSYINLLQMKHPRRNANLAYNPMKIFCAALPEIIAACFFWLYSFALFYFLETAKK
jgi:hypothetical protein